MISDIIFQGSQQCQESQISLLNGLISKTIQLDLKAIICYRHEKCIAFVHEMIGTIILLLLLGYLLFMCSF